jgi:DNA-directed RNA polymerase subunit RPC12/RpoP
MLDNHSPYWQTPCIGRWRKTFMIRFTCTACTNSIEVGDDLAETEVLCPRCKWRLLVPPAPLAEADAAVPPVGVMMAAAYRKGLRKGLLIGSSVTVALVLMLAGGGWYGFRMGWWLK